METCSSSPTKSKIGQSSFRQVSEALSRFSSMCVTLLSGIRQQMNNCCSCSDEGKFWKAARLSLPSLHPWRIFGACNYHWDVAFNNFYRQRMLIFPHNNAQWRGLELALVLPVVLGTLDAFSTSKSFQKSHNLSIFLFGRYQPGRWRVTCERSLTLSPYTSFDINHHISHCMMNHKKMMEHRWGEARTNVTIFRSRTWEKPAEFAVSKRCRCKSSTIRKESQNKGLLNTLLVFK